jgi:predicted flap endonuclease-1-like 5' DNA nuclease
VKWSWFSFLIGLLVGRPIEWLIDIFFWRRRRSTQREVDAARLEALQAKLDQARARQRELEAQLADRKKLVAVASDLEAGRAVVKETPAVVEVAPEEPQELTRVNGIGPKISSILNEAGILNYAQLAQASVDRLREILAEAGSRFRMADPSSWPQQARLLAEDKRDELKALP